MREAAKPRRGGALCTAPSAVDCTARADAVEAGPSARVISQWAEDSVDSARTSSAQAIASIDCAFHKMRPLQDNPDLINPSSVHSPDESPAQVTTSSQLHSTPANASQAPARRFFICAVHSSSSSDQCGGILLRRVSRIISDQWLGCPRAQCNRRSAHCGGRTVGSAGADVPSEGGAERAPWKSNERCLCPVHHFPSAPSAGSMLLLPLL